MLLVERADPLPTGGASRDDGYEGWVRSRPGGLGFLGPPRALVPIILLVTFGQ